VTTYQAAVPATQAVTEAPETATPPPPPAQSYERVNLRDAEDLVRRAKADNARLDADAHASPAERARATATYAGALRTLADIQADDESELTESKIVAYKSFRDHLARFRVALTTFPEAARAMLNALEEKP
jgi:hypothetical protein